MSLVLDQVQLDFDEFHLRADLKVEKGEVLAVIGPSGGGKSTLLSVIGGFLMPDHGRIGWDGADLTALPASARPVSMVFQEHNLFPHLTAFQNVALGVAPSMRLNQEEHAAVMAALEQVGLEGLDARKPAELSGGQRGRVAIARVLVMARPVLLLDEPFAALGPALRQEMLGLVREVARDRDLTVLLVTHQPDDARRADRVVLVENGTVGTPQDCAEAFANPEPALAAYLGK